MKLFAIATILMILMINSSLSKENEIKIFKVQENDIQSGDNVEKTIKIPEIKGIAEPGPLNLPIYNSVEIPKTRKSDIKFNKKSSAPLILYNEEVAYSEGEKTLFENDYAVFEVNTEKEEVLFPEEDFGLAEECSQALELSPVWLRKHLIIKFRVLKPYNLDDVYAKLIISAEDDIRDEVAFQVAHLSKQVLSSTRFRKDIDVIKRNAEMVYTLADSLYYVDLVEHGNYEARDYYTSARYRVLDGSDTIWVEAPREIYYWYVVHPKIRQEGVYVSDDLGNNQQRTYDYFWRDYIWSNPNTNFDYTDVNISNSKGSVDKIQRFGELVQKPKILWDRQKTYFSFLRDYKDTDHVLDVIGNWASRAIPVDAVLPRAIQPNQALYEHNGNCGEDAYLLIAACRTALIPCIHRNTSCEDHAFAAIWETEWNHYEFFRGGLSPNGNNFYGITNLLKGGSYGWVTSCVTGYRPDGFCENHTEEYTNLCTISMDLKDKNGVPIDGAQVILWADPYAYNAGYYEAGNFWTGTDGHVEMKVGGRLDGNGKKYACQIYHPDFGIVPSAEQVYILVNTPALAGANYKIPFTIETWEMPAMDFGKILPLPETSEYGVNLSWDTYDIIVGAMKDRNDFPWDEFYYWDYTGRSGLVSLFICDSTNFELFKSGKVFEAYNPVLNNGMGDITMPLPGKGKWYIVYSTKSLSNNFQHLNASCTLLKGEIINSVADGKEADLAVYPNPFTVKCNFELPKNTTAIEIIDFYGNTIDRLETGVEHWQPGNSISSGLYLIRALAGNKIYTGKALYLK